MCVCAYVVRFYTHESNPLCFHFNITDIYQYFRFSIVLDKWKFSDKGYRVWWMKPLITSNFFREAVQYIPRNMHTVFALLCFVVVIHWLICPYPSGLLHWHCGNLTIAPVPAKQPWWIWINTSCEFIMNDCITTTKQSTTKPCAYFLGYTVFLCCAVWFIRFYTSKHNAGTWTWDR